MKINSYQAIKLCGKRTKLNLSEEESLFGDAFMGCWRWFGEVLKEAGINVTKDNTKRIEEVIHEVIGETSIYKRCSGDWRKIGKQIKADENEKKKLIQKLQTSLG